LTESKYDFEQTYAQLYNIVKLNGYSLGIILKEVTILLINNCELFSQKKFAQLYTDLSDLETKVSQSTFDDIYISTLISIFKKNNM
jgi:hypothetical protein